MTNPLPALKALHQKYNGPIPREELDKALGLEIAATRKARTQIKFWGDQFQTALNARAKLEKTSEQYTDEQWEDWDDRTTLDISQARDEYEKWSRYLATLRAAEMPTLLAAE